MDIKLIINNRETTFNDEISLLENLGNIGIEIPSLCYHKDLGSQDVCGICVVEIDGKLVKSCSTNPKEGMVVKTYTDEIEARRKEILEKLMETHPNDCLICEKAKGDCQLQDACYEYGVENRNEKPIKIYEIDRSTEGMIRDMNKCIKCEKCVVVCKDIQGIGVYDIEEKNGEKEIVLVGGSNLSETKCVGCGQCIKVCPVGALVENNTVLELSRNLKKREKHFLVQMAPAIKHTIGEEFFIAPGNDATSMMVGALKKLGFHKVFSTDYSADVTIMEEGTELIQRLTTGSGKTPMFTSCCPGWVNYVEKNHPEFLENLSSCKSPQQIFGALAKSYYAKETGIPKEDIVVVSIMPCTAKKGEAQRQEMEDHDGARDVDVVITTREFAKLVRMNNINFAALPEGEDYDSFMGKGSSAGRMFGTSGGVMEAALRTVATVLSDEEPGVLEFKEIRGFSNVKETRVEIGEHKLKLAVINGIGSAATVLEAIKSGELHYDFIEVMACHGGCISGGGAPIPDNMDVRKQRMEGMYDFDKTSTLRRSHDNPEIKKLYENYLVDPCGHKSHHLLHTTYSDKS
jgi:iron-only hydrogenase group A